MLDVADKLLIHELLSKAAHALDIHNIDNIMACFDKDANMTVNIAGGTVVGPFEGSEAIRGLMAGAIEVQTDVRKHVISNIFFEDSAASSANVASNLTLFSTENEKNKLVTTGCYHDTVKKVDGQWCIAERILDLDMPF